MTNSPVSLLAVRYRAKAKEARKRAASASAVLIRTTLLEAAKTYDRLARDAEKVTSKRSALDPHNKQQ